MTVYKVPQLWCDHCSEKIKAEEESTPAELRDTGKAAGWSVMKYGAVTRDFCESCTAGIVGAEPEGPEARDESEDADE